MQRDLPSGLHPITRYLVPAACALMLSACAGGFPQQTEAYYVPAAHYERYPIEVEKGSVTMEVSARQETLSNEELDDLKRFARHYEASGSGVLVIARPSSAPGDVKAAGVAARIDQEIRKAGIQGNRIAHRTYSPRGRGQAPVVVAFERHVASTRSCEPWNKDVADNYENDPLPNLGCATQHNIAAMVANPRDLETPRAMDRASAARRSDVLGKYERGQPTPTPRTDADSGRVSQVLR